MGKKAKEYKSGDFIFAKVKGYPAWPARVQKLNGKKYFVYFYGTGETANLPPNMIFDYAENKDKFLTKSVKRRDFNEGVKQIEHDFANNVPLEQIIGVNPEAPADASINDTANDSGNDETMDTTADTTSAEDTVADTTATTTQNDTAVEDSDEAGTLVIDEGKQPKPKKTKGEPLKTPAKETPAKTKWEPPKTPAKETPAKTPKTPRGKARTEKKDEVKPDEEEEKKDEEIVSRSGRKIRPKRYMDEQTEENSTLPSPAPKKKRGASPTTDKEEKKPEAKDKPADKSIKHFNAVSQSELEELKEPFKPADAEKDNILIAYLPTGQYVGIKLFQSRPASYKNDAARLQWDKQAAANAVTLKMQLERGHITPQSIIAQLVMDLNLTDEEKATLDKERETEEKRSRVQFLKTEMKLIELDAKIKTCLCLEKADTELCLKLLDELMELDVKPLMLLKHPTCLETVKRMRAYVGNTPSWDLSESDALLFGKQAHRIRKQADTLYKTMKDLFTTPEGLSFWEFFSERVLQFKKATSKLNADELLEMVHEPLEMTVPTSHTMKEAIVIVNQMDTPPEDVEDAVLKNNNPPAKSKKAANTPKPPLKRQSSRKQQQEEKDKEKDKETSKEPNKETDKVDKNDNPTDEIEKTDATDKESVTEKPQEAKQSDDSSKKDKNKEKVQENSNAEQENEKEQEKEQKTVEEPKNTVTDKPNGPETADEKTDEVTNDKNAVVENKNEKVDEKSTTKEEEKEKEKEVDEPRAKRSRGETKKTDPPPRSPAKRKSKAST